MGHKHKKHSGWIKERNDYLATQAGQPDAPAIKADATESYQDWWKGKKTCYHPGTAPVYILPPDDTRPEAKIFAGTESNIPYFKEPTLILDCAGRNPGYQSHKMPEGYEGLSACIKSLPVLQIPWPDGGIPDVMPDFWSKLMDLAHGNVYICCLGAHGRTGTALACLRLQMTPACTAREAIEEVRALHCEEAIETTDQVDYIYRIAEYTGGADMINDKGQPRATSAFVANWDTRYGTAGKTVEVITKAKPETAPGIKVPGPSGPTLGEELTSEELDAMMHKDGMLPGWSDVGDSE